MLGTYVWAVVIGAIFCFVLGFAMGANDVANNFGTSVGSKAISLKGAVIIAAIFELIGAVGFGASVTDAVRKGVFKPEHFGSMPDFLLMANFSALVGATIWLLVATQFSLPVSATHSLIGGLLGPGMVMGLSAVQWTFMGQVVLSWVVAPLLSMTLGSIVFVLLRTLIFRHDNGVPRTMRFLWLLVWWLCAVCCLFFTFSNPLVIDGHSCDMLQTDGSIKYASPCKVNKLVSAHPGIAAGIGLAAATALCLLVTPFLLWYARRRVRRFDEKAAELDESNAAVLEAGTVKTEQLAAPGEQLSPETTANGEDSEPLVKQKKNKWLFGLQLWNRDLHQKAYEENPRALKRAGNAERFNPRVEAVFATLQIISASMACLVHGSNDVSNAASPFASIYSIYEEGVFQKSVNVPIWILFLGGSAISIGLALWGYRVLQAVGVEMVYMTSCRGFSCEISMAMVLIAASFLGLPISSTHVFVGAMIGIGLMDRHYQTPSGELKKPLLGIFNLDGVDWRLALKFFASWIATVFACALLAAGIFAFSIFSPTRISTRFLPCEVWDEGCPI